MVNSDNATTNGRLMRYLLDLQEFNFTIYYRRGTENCDADAVSRLLRTSDKPEYLSEDDLCQETGVISKQMLHRARALDKRNREAEQKMKKLRAEAKEDLVEMSRLNDLILAEGVENLESKSGRKRFLKNLQELGLKCNHGKLSKTLEEMKEDRGNKGTVDEEPTVNVLANNCVEMINFLEIISSNEPEEEGWPEEKNGDDRNGPDEKEGRLVEDCLSLNSMVSGWKDNNPELWRERREHIMNRCEELSKMVLVNTRSRRTDMEREYTLRNVEEDIYEGIIEQPNWKTGNQEASLSDINQDLIAARRKGYDKVEVRKSLVPGESGQGLFAKKKIKDKETICSYEGVEVDFERTMEQGRNNDYVASAIRNQRTQDMVYIDGISSTSCYGRFAQDPIDEILVNAKILWRGNKLILVAMADIEDGEEIYVDYGIEYWQNRMALLHPRLRKVMESRVDPRRRDRFGTECQVAEFNTKESAKRINVLEEGRPLKRINPNYITRVRQEDDESEAQDSGNSRVELTEEFNERFNFHNVQECEELAEELQFLNGRKFIDEGRLYEIFQVRYDPEFERIIGFRKVLGSRPHREDGSAFLVYGKEGLYELSERYLLEHPEESDRIEWPRNNYEWAVKQREDGRVSAIIDQIEESGDTEAVVGRHKYRLISTQHAHLPLVMRRDEQHRKGQIDQVVVPGILIKKTMRLHHEGYGHMGANRMLETIRLRYFWVGMETDINQHCRDCINCKLRKAYQRRPKVPLMKYDDTARPLDRVHVDLTGPLPMTKAKHKYILVIKDYLTKNVWLIPTKSKGAVEIAEAFVGEYMSSGSTRESSK